MARLQTRKETVRRARTRFTTCGASDRVLGTYYGSEREHSLHGRECNSTLIHYLNVVFAFVCSLIIRFPSYLRLTAAICDADERGSLCFLFE